MKTKLRSILVSIVLSLLFATVCSAQAPIVGKWKTIDDETGKEKSIVQIFEKEGKYYGKIVKLFLKESDNQAPTCDKCPDTDDRKDQATLGMEILRGLVEKDGKFEDGKILDPKKGKEYTCKLWIDENNNLVVRGYIAMFYRTQTWLRIDE